MVWFRPESIKWLKTVYKKYESNDEIWNYYIH